MYLIVVRETNYHEILGSTTLVTACCVGMILPILATYLPLREHKLTFLVHLPTPSCPRSYWTTPYLKYLKILMFFKNSLLHTYSNLKKKSLISYEIRLANQWLQKTNANKKYHIFFISTYEKLELLPLFSFWMLWDQVTVVVLQSHLGLCGFIPGVATEMRSFHIARWGCRSGPLASTYCRWCCYASLRWAQNTWNSKNKTLVYIYNKLTRMIHGQI